MIFLLHTIPVFLNECEVIIYWYGYLDLYHTGRKFAHQQVPWLQFLNHWSFFVLIMELWKHFMKQWGHQIWRYLFYQSGFTQYLYEDSSFSYKSDVSILNAEIPRRYTICFSLDNVSWWRTGTAAYCDIINCIVSVLLDEAIL